MRKFAELLKQGLIKKEVFEEWAKATPLLSKLPERLGKAKKIKKVKVIK